MSVAAARDERVGGLAFMNTWYWKFDWLGPKIFSKVMSSKPLQRRILEQNFFVERLVPAGTTRKLSEAEMDHYRGVQSTPDARKGVAVFPHQILDAGPWLAELASSAPRKLAGKPAVLIWAMKDRAFGSKKFIARWQSDFPGADLTVLPRANHFIQEDAPEEIVNAVGRKFG
jgi:haloalkane dehalogenase